MTELIEQILYHVEKYHIKPISKNNVLYALSFLRKYGYISTRLDVTIQDVITGISELQVLCGHEPNGILEPKILSLMAIKRCGCPDIIRDESGNKIEAATGKWNKRLLSYIINGWVGDAIDKNMQQTIIRNCYDEISSVCNLKFIETTNITSADIVISVKSGRQNSLDGGGGVLAYAELPNGNDQQLNMVIDADEYWINDRSIRGILFRNVFLHEAGHNGGLYHSKIQTALMAPYYAPDVSTLQQNDDIIRWQQLYGAPAPNQPNPPTPIPPNQPPVNPTPSEQTLSIKYKGTIEAVSIPGYRCLKI